MSDSQPSAFPSSAQGVWVGPLLVLAIAAVIVWSPSGSLDSADELASLSGPRLSGSFLVGEEFRVGVSLEPMHEDAHRQRFDGGALAKRLGLEEGEPWRLKLVPFGEAPESEPSGVHVLEGQRECLSPLLDELAVSDGGVHDPLIALFQPRKEQEGEQAWEFVLWGEAPAFDGQLECSWGSASLSLVSSEEESGDPVVNAEAETSGASKAQE